jgi:phosphohistidine phosphatase
VELFLLRHAKSSWEHDGLPDHDRPLAPRGQRAAARLAAYVRDAGIRPELALCSSARRARETIEPIAPYVGEVRVDGHLYGATAAEVLERLHAVAPTVASVLVVAHNPGLQDLALGLAAASASDPAALAEVEAKFPTGAMAVITATATWDALTWGGGSLRRVVLPRSL